MSDNTIKFYLGNKSNFENDLNINLSGYENDSSNTPLVSDGKNLTIRNYGFMKKIDKEYYDLLKEMISELEKKNSNKKKIKQIKSVTHVGK